MRRARHNLIPAALLLADLTLLVITLPAAAQEKPRPGRYKLGPVYLTPRIVLPTVGVSSNVFNDEAAPVSDNTIVLTPGLEAVLPVGRHLRLSATGELGLHYFQMESEERSTDRRLKGEAELGLGPFTFRASGRVSRAKQRFSIEIDERLDRTASGVSFGVDLRLLGKVTLTVSGGRSASRFQEGVDVLGEDVKSSLDRRNFTRAASLSYALTRRTSLFLGVELIEDRFLEEDGTLDTATSQRYTGGFNFGLSALLNGRLLLGLRRFPRDTSQAVPASEAFSVDVSLGVPLTRSGQLLLLASRDFQYSVARTGLDSGRGRNSIVLGVYGATLDYELPLSLLARPSIRLQRAEYQQPFEQDGVMIDRVDRQQTVGMALFRAFGRSLRVGGTLEFSRRRSNINDFDFESWSYGVTAEFVP